MVPTAYAKDKGAPFVQAHAPFHSSFPDAAQTESRFQDIVRSMRYAALLGVQTMVVHPVQHLTYADSGVPERLFEMNMDFCRRLIPYCEEFGMRIGVENMWHYHPWPKITRSTCSAPEEMIRYVDTLNSPWITACLDTGHASLVGQAPHGLSANLVLPGWARCMCMMSARRRITIRCHIWASSTGSNLLPP